MRVILSVISLLLSTSLLLAGHGMQLTLVPLRGGSLGISEFNIGLSASFYFLGFAAGCLLAPRIIARVGHIRVFAVLCAVMISAILTLELVPHWPAWLVLRFLTGVAICGLYTVIESWLNSHATRQSRGRILAVYTFINLMSLTAGQFLINVGPIDAAVPFMVSALCIALAIVPVGMTRRMAPEPVEATRTGFLLLFRRSHSAFAGALLSGLVVGSFWALGALFAQRYSAGQADVTLFMSVAIVGGAVVQYPIGWLSDRFDRRRVLFWLTFGGIASSIAVALSIEQPWYLAAVFAFGACTMPMYAISLATAADVSSPDEFVTIGTSVLMLNAVGAIFAPLLLGELMVRFEATALFWSFTALCALFAIYIALQLRDPRAVSVEEQTPFKVAAADVAPAGFELDPRAEEPETSAGAPESREPVRAPAPEEELD